ncbi:ATP-binding protein [Flavobacterium sp.]|uniref:AAA family ATPase n=1 Tax=Flavobacterium sp. TaxID=239 RepID=UPI001B5A2B3C|nr:ATP-binding protein [Flavobacterium sp.]MBP6126695.1 ATP-binding protein [Flavobacterium sp.]
MNNQLDNIILTSVGEIYEHKHKSLFCSDIFLEKLQKDLLLVAIFFNVDIKSAAVFSIIICDQLSGETDSITTIMKSLGFKPMDFITTLEVLKQWKIKGLVRLRVVRSNRSTNDYLFTDEVIDGVINNDASRFIFSIPKNQNEAFLNIKHFISKSLYAVEKDILTDTILNYVSKFSEFQLIREVLDSKVLNFEEKAVLFYIISHHQYGIQEFDLEQILDYFDDDSSLSFRFKQRIVSEKSILFSEEYLEFETPEFVDFTLVLPGEKIKKHIVSHEVCPDNKNFTTKYAVQIKPEEIENVDLFFNEQTNQSITQIFELTSDKYRDISKKFELNGLKSGLTMLFYGFPGTGKTELVKQIAKKNNRVLLLVDVAAIKSKWVGESERNIKRVFHEYNLALKFYEKEPILFFNECDALISKRNTVTSSVDQMNNAMQNIVLQELEDFKGIFIATTNLIQNIDTAFDRRILYKLPFDKPEQPTRLKILKSQFPQFSNESLTNVSFKYDLSGGQIQNIKKKYLVEEILFNNTNSTSDNLTEYIESEVNFRITSKKTIGF